MPTTNKTLKIVYVTPALYMAGGVERVLSLKANYFVEHFGYDITIILTEGKGKPLFYALSDRIKIINLDIGFEELWACSFLKKVFLYLKKQHRYKKLLSRELILLRPDITISLLRREINFLTDINDGSRKIGEMHVNRANYRNFKTEQVGLIQHLFSYFWSSSLLKHLEKLDKLVVLTDKDRNDWHELNNVVTIPNPLSLNPSAQSPLIAKRVVAIARYSHEKGIDLLLKSWSLVEKRVPDWRLDVFGDGDRTIYDQLIDELLIDRSRCLLHGRTNSVENEYINSSILVLSSRFEGFGLVLPEAMACGLPVVSFDCPWGPRSIIVDGEDGILINNGDTEALADGLCKLMSDGNLRLSMAKAGVKNVQRFKIDHIAEQWRGIFESNKEKVVA